MTTIRWKEVSLSKRGRTLLDGVSLTANAGEVLGIVGPNGAGKSSLLRAAVGLEPTISGSVEIAGTALANIPARRRARILSYLPQQAEAAWPISVEEAVWLGRRPHLGITERRRESDRTAVAAAMKSLSVSGLADRR